MVQYENGLDGAFAALADPTRRGILERLGGGKATITELAEPFGMSLTGIKKHVQVLERAGMLSTEKQGRTRYCRLGPRGLEDVRQWVDAYRYSLEGRLDRFGEMLAEDVAQASTVADELGGRAMHETKKTPTKGEPQ